MYTKSRAHFLFREFSDTPYNNSIKLHSLYKDIAHLFIILIKKKLYIFTIWRQIMNAIIWIQLWILLAVLPELVPEPVPKVGKRVFLLY